MAKNKRAKIHEKLEVDRSLARHAAIHSLDLPYLRSHRLFQFNDKNGSTKRGI